MRLDLRKPILKVSVPDTPHIANQIAVQSAPSLTIEQVERIYRQNTKIENFIREMIKESKYDDGDYWGTVHWFIEHIPSSRTSQGDHFRKVYRERILPKFKN